MIRFAPSSLKGDLWAVDRGPPRPIPTTTHRTRTPAHTKQSARIRCIGSSNSSRTTNRIHSMTNKSTRCGGRVWSPSSRWYWWGDWLAVGHQQGWIDTQEWDEVDLLQSNHLGHIVNHGERHEWWWVQFRWLFRTSHHGVRGNDVMDFMCRTWTSLSRSWMAYLNKCRPTTASDWLYLCFIKFENRSTGHKQFLIKKEKKLSYQL